MKIFKISDLEKLPKDNYKRVAALGFFDGVHYAHQEIIRGAVDKAKKSNMKSVVITLDISPKQYFRNEAVNSVTPTSKKIEIVEQLGVEEIYILEFTDQLRKLSREDFVSKVLKTLNIDEVYCGYDYQFGN